MSEILRVDKEEDDRIYTYLSLGDYNYHHFGLLVADIIRHISKAYEVTVDDVLTWVHKELASPTTEIKRISLN